MAWEVTYMKAKITVLCFCLLLISNICFAWEGRPICDLGAERLYNRIVEAGVNIGAGRNEFTALKRGVNGDAYSFIFPSSIPNKRNEVMLFTNKAGYVTMILIDGSNTTKENSDSMLATMILNLRAIGLNADEIQYAINNFKKNNYEYRLPNDNSELYTSDIYVKSMYRTVTIMLTKRPDAHVQACIAVIR